MLHRWQFGKMMKWNVTTTMLKKKLRQWVIPIPWDTHRCSNTKHTCMCPLNIKLNKHDFLIKGCYSEKLQTNVISRKLQTNVISGKLQTNIISGKLQTNIISGKLQTNVFFKNQYKQLVGKSYVESHGTWINSIEKHK